jgi:hypothetical protein
MERVCFDACKKIALGLHAPGEFGEIPTECLQLMHLLMSEADIVTRYEYAVRIHELLPYGYDLALRYCDEECHGLLDLICETDDPTEAESLGAILASKMPSLTYFVMCKGVECYE